MNTATDLRRPRVLLADDHTILTEGLAVLLRPEVDVVGLAADGRELVQMAEQFSPDIIVTDISMPLLNGLDALRLLRKSGIRSKVIILTMHEEASLVAEAFHLGASGFLVKQTACMELLTAIREVWQGREFITSRLRADFVTLLARNQEQPKSESRSPLTPRQRQILQLTAEGKTMKQVAALLGISVKTVEAHKYALMAILGLSSNAELVRYAIKAHII